MRPTSIVTAVAAVAALTGATSASAWRLRQRNARRSLGVDPSGICEFATGPAARERNVFAPLDGTRSGPAVAALREMYSSDGGSVDVVLDSFADDELISSIAEVTGILAVQANNAEATEQRFDPEDDTVYLTYDVALATLLGGRGLLLLARDHEGEHLSHVGSCAGCRRDGSSAHLVRAQWCRDLADELITNPEASPFLVHDVDIADALHVLQDVFEHYCDATGTEATEAVEALAHGLALTAAVQHSPGGVS